MFFTQFSSPDWESCDTIQAKINSQIFAKQMSRSSITLFKYPLKKALAKSTRKNCKPSENRKQSPGSCSRDLHFAGLHK